MLSKLRRFQIVFGAATLVAACDPNVVIGARWGLDQGGSGGQGAAGAPVGAGAGTGGAAGGSETMSGASGAADGGTAGAAAVVEWCATAPWQNTPAQFGGDSGKVIPAGDYLITYMFGALIHDLDIGYEVTSHYYGKNGLQAGHHVYNGESPESSPTSLWLDQNGLVHGGTLAEVENANRGHTWPLKHSGGELFIALYDDDYHDNVGPGSRFCITAAAP